MSAVHALHLSPFQAILKTMGWALRFMVLVILYFSLFAVGGQVVGPYMPAIIPEPGPFPLMTAFRIFALRLHWLLCDD